MEMLRVGIIGCGFTGSKHAANIELIKGAEVTAVTDVDPDKAHRLSQSLADPPKVMETAVALVESGEADAIFVCLPPFAHGDEVSRAASAGLHVFMEKPIALTSAKALEMVEAVESAGVVNMVGYMLRYSEAIVELRSFVESGRAGKPIQFRGSYSCNALHAPWWRDKSKSGGQLFEQAIHIFDQALQYLGTPLRVAAEMGNLCHTGVEGYTVEDTSASVIRFESGAIASIASSNCSIPEKWTHEYTLVCENLVGTVVDGKDLTITFTDGMDRAIKYETFNDDPYLAEDAAFVAAIADGALVACPLSTGYEGVRLVEAATQSAQTGNSVDLR